MARNVLLLIGLMFAATMLSGCVIEPAPGYYHHGWWGWHHHHHHDWDRD